MTLPPGFERLLLGHAIAVARSDVAPAIRRALVSADGTRSTLHDYAARHPAARRLEGRGAAYAIPLPEGAPPQRVVVRHNRHGGLFARLTGDRFLAPTRAPHELEMSLELARRGVATPQLLAYAVYPPGGMLQRADVCSGEIANARDLADVLTGDDTAVRQGGLAATARLLATLARAQARHHDLNAKNVLLSQGVAYVLDVDRVVLGGAPEAVFDGNMARLARSLRKRRDRFGARVDERDIAELESAARQALA